MFIGHSFNKTHVSSWQEWSWVLISKSQIYTIGMKLIKWSETLNLLQQCQKAHKHNNIRTNYIKASSRQTHIRRECFQANVPIRHPAKRSPSRNVKRPWSVSLVQRVNTSLKANTWATANNNMLTSPFAFVCLLMWHVLTVWIPSSSILELIPFMAPGTNSSLLGQTWAHLTVLCSHPWCIQSVRNHLNQYYVLQGTSHIFVY